MTVTHFIGKQAVCPHCQTVIDGATDPAGKGVPKKDDLSICAYCDSMLIFNEDLSVRLLSESEFAALPIGTQRQLVHYQHIARTVRKRKGQQ